MSSKKIPQEKTRLHVRNKNRERYDLQALTSAIPELAQYVAPNKHGVESVDFSNPIAVKLLNKALLHHYYGITTWEFPEENLCPPIPGRADYIHHVADLLCENNFGNIPTGDGITCMDIGVGANCIYPIIGVTEYGWKFIGTDIDPKSIASAEQIVLANASLSQLVSFRLQEKRDDVFFGVLGTEELIDVSICNPPFHASNEEAQKGTRRKVKNLTGKEGKSVDLNFGGIASELICHGGERGFVHNMIRESEKYGKNCFWFSTLVSKQSNLKGIRKALEEKKAQQIRTIPMGTGNKSTRIVAWSFLTADEQKEWKMTRWKGARSKPSHS